jgi:hypothetical protein
MFFNQENVTVTSNGSTYKQSRALYLQLLQPRKPLEYLVLNLSHAILV